MTVQLRRTCACYLHIIYYKSRSHDKDLGIPGWFAHDRREHVQEHLQRIQHGRQGRFIRLFGRQYQSTNERLSNQPNLSERTKSSNRLSQLLEWSWSRLSWPPIAHVISRRWIPGFRRLPTRVSGQGPFCESWIVHELWWWGFLCSWWHSSMSGFLTLVPFLLHLARKTGVWLSFGNFVV